MRSYFWHAYLPSALPSRFDYETSVFWRRLTIGWSDRGAASSMSQGGVDDLDKLPSLDAGAAPRRSTSSLGANSVAPPSACANGYHADGVCDRAKGRRHILGFSGILRVNSGWGAAR